MTPRTAAHDVGDQGVGSAPNGHAAFLDVRERGTAARVRYSRRRGLIGLGVALLALGGGGAYVLAERASDAVEVIAMMADVPRGHVISEHDLTTASAMPDPALAPIPASRIPEIVGQRAAADLSRGSLLTDGSVTTQMLPAAGETVVGVAVTEAQLPTEPITPGSRVRIFDTPNAGDDPPDTTPDSIAASVVSVTSEATTGHIVVNVLVRSNVAGDLVARVATGRVGIVLDSLEDGGDGL